MAGERVTNEFRKRVYEITARIPRGKVSCYGQIAFLAGHPRAARIVGALMHTAPSELPCHRVTVPCVPVKCSAALPASGRCWNRRGSDFCPMAGRI